MWYTLVNKGDIESGKIGKFLAVVYFWSEPNASKMLKGLNLQSQFATGMYVLPGHIGFRLTKLEDKAVPVASTVSRKGRSSAF